MMRPFLAAVSMLSILPLGPFVPTEDELKKSLNLFPVAGVLFGALLYGAGVLAEFLPSAVGAMALALLPEVLTKGFHLDGAADTADGFLSGRGRERKLEIMRDSHIGTMGVAAIFAILGLKFSVYLALPPELRAAAAGISALSGRCGILWHIASSRYARPEGGLGKLWFSGKKPIPGLILALLFTAGAGCRSGGWSGPLLFAAVFPLAGWGWSRITRAVVGGATGDTIGCFEELSELLALALFLCLY